MDASRAHLLKLTNAGLNTLAVHAKELLFYRSIWAHIGTLDGNHGDTVAGIKPMAQRLADRAAITEQHGTK